MIIQITYMHHFYIMILQCLMSKMIKIQTIRQKKILLMVLDDSYVQDLVHKHSDLEDTFFDEYADDIVDQSFYNDANFLSEQLNYDEEEFEHVDTNNDFLLHSYYGFLSQRIKMPITDVHYDLFDISDERIF